jgi:hypothetical protein
MPRGPTADLREGPHVIHARVAIMYRHARTPTTGGAHAAQSIIAVPGPARHARRRPARPEGPDWLASGPAPPDPDRTARSSPNPIKRPPTTHASHTEPTPRTHRRARRPSRRGCRGSAPPGGERSPACAPRPPPRSGRPDLGPVDACSVLAPPRQPHGAATAVVDGAAPTLPPRRRRALHRRLDSYRCVLGPYYRGIRPRDSQDVLDAGSPFGRPGRRHRGKLYATL